jgi:hypothetical protein
MERYGVSPRLRLNLQTSIYNNQGNQPMLIYANLTDYLQDKSCLNGLPQLRGRDRPFLVLEDDEELTKQYPFLMQRQPSIYEIGFPWVQITDWEQQKAIVQKLSIEIKTGAIIELNLADEVLDETQISNDENEVKNLKDQLSAQFERETADMIALFIGLFDALFGEDKHSSQSPCFLINIPQILVNLSQEDAQLPLVLALNRRYELRHKLEIIAPKLRSQLNRKAEMIPLGRIQEMDAYCLRDYVRRPGHDAIEKAGARQELMGIQRYQNFNTPENRFLKGFCNLLHRECGEYKGIGKGEAERLERAIDRFRQEPSVQTIPRTDVFAIKPNYVLQQNPIYRSFYQAYLDYLKRRSEKENIWGFRQGLLVDVVTILLVAALLNIEGSYIRPTASVNVSGVPNYGRYLLMDSPLIIDCILQTAAFNFEIMQPNSPKSGDLELKVKMQYFTTNLLEKPKDKKYVFPIWIFWYKPSDAILESMVQSQQKANICLYLYENFSEINDTTVSNSHIKTWKLPNPIDENLEEGMTFLTNHFCEAFGGWIT